MEIFYTDKSKKFECNIDIDGADINETKARLALSFDKSNVKYIYEGSISKNGKCTIKIPEMKHTPNIVGNVVLEVIAENTYFEPWSDDFIVKQHKNVVVERIMQDVEEEEIVNEDVKISVSVGNKNIEKPIVAEQKKDSLLPPSLYGIVNESDFVEFIQNTKRNESLLEEYVRFQPKILTQALAEKYELNMESKKDKMILFFMEKKII